VKALNGVGRIDQLADSAGILEAGGEFFPVMNKRERALNS
jgi:hypothetical protein